MKRFLPRFIALFLLSPAIAAWADPPADLASPSQEVRDAAAKILRASYTPPPQEKWKALLASLTPGMPMTKVFEILQPYEATRKHFGLGFAGQDPPYGYTYRLDELCMVDCVYDRKDNANLVKIALRKNPFGMPDVQALPPDGFTGTWTTYYINGQPALQRSYKEGAPSGEWKTFYEDGVLRRVRHCTPHGYEGEEINYHPSGKISARGSYKADKPAGTWTWYNEDGSVKETKSYPPS